MKIDRYFRTVNLNLAIFLYSKDQQICGINPINKDQKEFAFMKTDVIEELIDLYKFGGKDDDRLQVGVHKYEQARRDLLDRLNE